MYNLKRLFVSALAGFGLGFLVEYFASIWLDPSESVNGFLMIVIIIGGAIGAYFIFLNNNYIKK